MVMYYTTPLMQRVVRLYILSLIRAFRLWGFHNERNIMSIPIPHGATRVQVKDEYGKIVWKKPSDINKVSDTVQVNPKTGEAYVMYGTPGVPSSNPAPSSAIVANLNSLQQRKKSKVKSDKVLGETKSNPESENVLTQVLVGLAEETASLAFEREEAERRGEATSQISVRRVNALKAVGDTWLKKKEILSSKSIDLESKAFKKLFGHIAGTFRKACDEAGVRPELAESIFATFGSIVDDPDWILDAKKAMEKDK